MDLEDGDSQTQESDQNERTEKGAGGAELDGVRSDGRGAQQSVGTGIEGILVAGRVGDACGIELVQVVAEIEVEEFAVKFEESLGVSQIGKIGQIVILKFAETLVGDPGLESHVLDTEVPGLAGLSELGASG